MTDVDLEVDEGRIVEIMILVVGASDQLVQTEHQDISVGHEALRIQISEAKKAAPNALHLKALMVEIADLNRH